MGFLYQHQRKIVADDKKKVGIFLGTGSGKTLISLLLAKKRVLVIAPKTQRDDQNWEREMFKSRLAVNLTVISKEDFRRDWNDLPKFDTIIGEEAHTLLGVTPNTRWRNKQEIPKASQLYEALMGYIEKHQPDRIYMVSATIMKTPMTVWAASQALQYRDMEGKPWDFFEFRKRFYVKLPVPGRDIWVVKNDSATKDLLASLVRKLGYVGRLDDYFDVPTQVYRTVHIELTPKQKARIKDMMIEYPDPMVRAGKIHQIENGTLSGDEFNASESFENGKVDKILEYADEFPRMIVFAKYTDQIRQIAVALKEAKKKVIVISGFEKQNRGEALKEAAEASECVVVVQAQISAGWELKEYPVMIFASKTYSFVDYDQAIGRIQRADNIKKNLYIDLVVKGGPDEAVNECVENKKDFNERIYANR